MLRAPGVRSAAVYAVPDDPVGDRVMVAVEVDDLDAFDVDEFDDFVPAQPDLGPKWVPSFVRVDGRAAQAGEHEDRQDPAPSRGLERPGRQLAAERGEPLRPMTPADVDALAHLLP